MRLNPGLSTLTGVLIISSLLLAAGLTLHASLRNTLVEQTVALEATQLESVARSCALEGWHQLEDNLVYTGSNITLDDGDCQISVTNQGKTYMITVDARQGVRTEQYMLTLEEESGALIPQEYTHTF